MISFIEKKRPSVFYKAACAFIAFSFLFTVVLPPQLSYAQILPQLVEPAVLNLPALGTMVGITPSYVPPMVSGITVHPDNPLQFNFIIDKGDENLEGDALKEESRKLIKYFLASLTTPEDELWVNLSPYEKDRIITDSFGQTEMGRDMLAQDYILKQLTASLIYPEEELGKKFWDRVYEKAYEMYGTREFPMNTFNKVWIVPEKATVYATGNSAYVIGSRLKVMLEEDYVALNHHIKSTSINEANMATTEDTKVVSGITSEIIREIIIPELEHEVNNGKSFANLRQIFNSAILSTWYKQNLKESLLGQIYVDKSKIKGVDVEDKEIKLKIYNQYLESLKKGVFDYIREDYDPQTRESNPRKYFSGGSSVASNVEVKRPGDKLTRAEVERIPDDTDAVNVEVVLSEMTAQEAWEDQEVIDKWVWASSHDQKQKWIEAFETKKFAEEQANGYVEEHDGIVSRVSTHIEEFISEMQSEEFLQVFKALKDRALDIHPEHRYPPQINFVEVRDKDRLLLVLKGREMSDGHASDIGIHVIVPRNRQGIIDEYKLAKRVFHESGAFVGLEHPESMAIEIVFGVWLKNPKVKINKILKNTIVQKNFEKEMDAYERSLNAKGYVLPEKWKGVALQKAYDLTKESIKTNIPDGIRPTNLLVKMSFEDGPNRRDIAKENQFDRLESKAEKKTIKILFSDLPAGKDATIDAVNQALTAIRTDMSNADLQILKEHSGVGEEDPLGTNGKLQGVIEKEKPDIVLVRSTTKAFKNEEFVRMAQANGVRAIIRMGAGTETINSDEAREQGISVIRTHGNADSVADLVLFKLAELALVDGYPVSDFQGEATKQWSEISATSSDEYLGLIHKNRSKKGRWAKEITEEQKLEVERRLEKVMFNHMDDNELMNLAKALHGKIIGLLGFGPTAQIVAEKLKEIKDAVEGLEFEVIAATRSFVEGDESRLALAEELDVIPVLREDLFKRADIVSIHLAGIEALQLTESELSNSNLTAIINTARTGLAGVDFLRGFVDRGGIYLADLDISNELYALSRDNPKKVFIFPHIAASTKDAARGVEENTKISVTQTARLLLGQEIPDEELKLDIVNGVMPSKLPKEDQEKNRDDAEKIFNKVLRWDTSRSEAGKEEFISYFNERNVSLAEAEEVGLNILELMIVEKGVDAAGTDAIKKFGVSADNLKNVFFMRIYEYVLASSFRSVGFSQDPEGYGYIASDGDGARDAPRYGKSMDVNLEKIEKFLIRQYGEKYKEFLGDAIVVVIGVGGQSTCVVQLGGINKYGNRDLVVLDSLGTDYNALEEQWVAALRANPNTKLMWIVGSKSGRTDETMVNFQNTLRAMIRVQSRVRFSDVQGKEIAESMINKLWNKDNPIPLAEHTMETLGLSVLEKGILQTVFKSAIFATGTWDTKENTGSLLDRMIKRGFLGELYDREEDGVIAMEMLLNLGGRFQGIGPNSFAINGALGYDLEAMLEAGRKEAIRQRQGGYVTEDIAKKLVTGDIKHMIIGIPDERFELLAEALGQTVPESTGKGRQYGMTFGVQTFKYTPDLINDAFEFQPKNKFYFLIDIKGQEPIRLDPDIEGNNFVYRFVMDGVNEQEFARVIQFVEDMTAHLGMINVARALIAMQEKGVGVGLDLNNEVVIRQIMQGPDKEAEHFEGLEELHKVYNDITPFRQPGVEMAKGFVKSGGGMKLFNSAGKTEKGLPVRDAGERAEYYQRREALVSKGPVMQSSELALRDSNGKYNIGNDAHVYLNGLVGADLGMGKELSDTQKEIVAMIKHAHKQGKAFNIVIYEDRNPETVKIKEALEKLGADRVDFGPAEQHKSRQLAVQGVDVAVELIIQSARTKEKADRVEEDLIADGTVADYLNGLKPSEARDLYATVYAQVFQGEDVQTETATLYVKDLTEADNASSFLDFFNGVYSEFKYVDYPKIPLRQDAGTIIESVIDKVAKEGKFENHELLYWIYDHVPEVAIALTRQVKSKEDKIVVLSWTGDDYFYTEEGISKEDFKAIIEDIVEKEPERFYKIFGVDLRRTEQEVFDLINDPIVKPEYVEKVIEALKGGSLEHKDFGSRWVKEFLPEIEIQNTSAFKNRMRDNAASRAIYKEQTGKAKKWVKKGPEDKIIISWKETEAFQGEDRYYKLFLNGEEFRIIFAAYLQHFPNDARMVFKKAVTIANKTAGLGFKLPVMKGLEKAIPSKVDRPLASHVITEIPLDDIEGNMIFSYRGSWVGQKPVSLYVDEEGKVKLRFATFNSDKDGLVNKIGETKEIELKEGKTWEGYKEIIGGKKRYDKITRRGDVVEIESEFSYGDWRIFYSRKIFEELISKAEPATSKKDHPEEMRHGGIDLNPAHFELQIKMDGNGVPLPVYQQPIGDINIDGFIPVIINITPVTGLPLILGEITVEDETGEDVSLERDIQPIDEPRARFEFEEIEQISMLN